jgi:hypothetical protein
LRICPKIGSVLYAGSAKHFLNSWPQREGDGPQAGWQEQKTHKKILIAKTYLKT